MNFNLMYKHITIEKTGVHNGMPIYNIYSSRTTGYLGRTYCNTLGVYSLVTSSGFSIDPFQLVDITTLIVNLCDGAGPKLDLTEKDQYEF